MNLYITQNQLSCNISFAFFYIGLFLNVCGLFLVPKRGEGKEPVLALLGIVSISLIFVQSIASALLFNSSSDQVLLLMGRDILFVVLGSITFMVSSRDNWKETLISFYLMGYTMTTFMLPELEQMCGKQPLRSGASDFGKSITQSNDSVSGSAPLQTSIAPSLAIGLASPRRLS
jgi:hypothetical protein